MATSSFSQFKSLLKSALQDADFIRKNTIYQNSAFLTNELTRIDALTNDISVKQDYSDVISTLGMVDINTSARNIEFDPKGFEITLSAYREAVTGEPRRLFRRSSVTDGIYYLLADGGFGVADKGVGLLNSSLEFLRRFPGYGTDIGSGQYEDAGDAITFTISSVEYVAICCTKRQVVQIYLYDAPYTNVATIGTLDTAGAATDLLTSPWSLAVDETNEKLYIACPTGQPAGATASNGFIAIYDISTPASPTFDSIDLYYSGTGSLLDNQIHTPNDIYYDGSLLWVSNSEDSTVGAFDVSGAAPICNKFIPTSGNGYTLRTPQQVYIRSLTGGFKRLYVANSANGTIEEFDYNTFEHINSYGYRASEDNLNSYTRMSSAVYGALANPNGVVADSVVIDGQTTNVLITTDLINIRLQRFNLDAYTTDNFANFDWITFDVPVVIDGWNLAGTLPFDLVKVYYRFAETESFRELPLETALPETARVQFRIAFQLDPQKFLSNWTVSHLRIHGKQA